MAPSLETGYFDSLNGASLDVAKEAELVDGWWTDPKLFQLERRAIFSKIWLCTTHASRLRKSGDYISFSLAGYPLFLILGKDNILRAFHNVCRHRAYTVARKAAGSSLVLGCRYHGWSYNTQGKLVKAPQFDNVLGFDKSANGLFECHACVDRAGFVWVCLDARKGLDVGGPACEGVIEFGKEWGFKRENSWLQGWEMQGQFNWKVATATYNTFAKDQTHELGIFPLTTIRIISGTPLWASTTVFPTSPIQSTVRCDIYSSEPIADLTKIKSMLESIEQDFKMTVQSLEQRYSVLKDSAMACQKTTVEGNEPLLTVLKAHLKMEKVAGAEIMPGARREGFEGRSPACERAEQVCRELDGLAGLTASGLAW